jgi:hypothetical protein
MNPNDLDALESLRLPLQAKLFYMFLIATPKRLIDQRSATLWFHAFAIAQNCFFLGGMIRRQKGQHAAFALCMPTVAVLLIVGEPIGPETTCIGPVASIERLAGANV